jgi:hypothetical protein
LGGLVGKDPCQGRTGAIAAELSELSFDEFKMPTRRYARGRETLGTRGFENRRRFQAMQPILKAGKDRRPRNNHPREVASERVPSDAPKKGASGQPFHHHEHVAQNVGLAMSK